MEIKWKLNNKQVSYLVNNFLLVENIYVDVSRRQIILKFGEVVEITDPVLSLRYTEK